LAIAGVRGSRAASQRASMSRLISRAQDQMRSRTPVSRLPSGPLSMPVNARSFRPCLPKLNRSRRPSPHWRVRSIAGSAPAREWPPPTPPRIPAIAPGVRLASSVDPSIHPSVICSPLPLPGQNSLGLVVRRSKGLEGNPCTKCSICHLASRGGLSRGRRVTLAQARIPFPPADAWASNIQRQSVGVPVLPLFRMILRTESSP